MTITTTFPLAIENANNKLACNFFSHIHFAPRKSGYRNIGQESKLLPGDITEDTFNKVFLIKNNDTEVLVQLHDFRRLTFQEISSSDTLLASGMMQNEWKSKFITKYPHVNNETEMAIYFYARIV
jgi:hypothetical protein